MAGGGNTELQSKDCGPSNRPAIRVRKLIDADAARSGSHIQRGTASSDFAVDILPATINLPLHGNGRIHRHPSGSRVRTQIVRGVLRQSNCD